MANRKIKIASHRGNEGTQFGLHSRVNYKLDKLSSSSLLVFSYLDMDQYMDRAFSRGGERRAVGMDDMARVLNISKRTINRSLKELRTLDIIKAVPRGSAGTVYITQTLKFNIQYQIITYSFIYREDINNLSKSFILKLLMIVPSERDALVSIKSIAERLGMTRRSVSKALKDLEAADYIYIDTSGNLVIDAEGLMLDSRSRLIEDKIKVDTRLITAMEVISDRDKMIGFLETSAKEYMAENKDLQEQVDSLLDINEKQSKLLEKALTLNKQYLGIIERLNAEKAVLERKLLRMTPVKQFRTAN